MSDQLIWASAALAALIFIVVAVFTRPGPRRIIAVLIAGAAAAALNVGWDVAAARAGWWRYTCWEGGHGPWPLYLPVLFLYGAAFSLIGWRAMRRWGVGGLVGFLIAAAALGLLRDRAYAQYSGIIQYGPGLQPWFADALGWLSLLLLTQALMRLLAGPAGVDRPWAP